MTNKLSSPRFLWALLLLVASVGLLVWLIDPARADSPHAPDVHEALPAPAHLEAAAPVRFGRYEASLVPLGDRFGTFQIRVDGEPRWRWSGASETSSATGTGYARVYLGGEHVMDLRNSALGLAGLQAGSYELAVELLHADGTPIEDDAGDPVRVTGTVISRGAVTDAADPDVDVSSHGH